ncbi:MAG: trigger factor [Gammaproteobacteria bacterium]|nr:trigger factor [Gammaproteobacteria bacterium]
MEIALTETQGLERRMSMGIEADKVDQEMQVRLKSLSKKVKIDGFRLGKVPLSVVKSRYSSQVKQEVLDELVKSAFSEAIQKESLKLAGPPRFEIEKEDEFQFAAIFEVFPEVEIVSIEKMKIEKPQSEVVDEDVDKMIDVLREQNLSWKKVDRKAKNKDRVEIDFVGTIDGEEFNGNRGEHVSVTLGSNGMIKGFEEGLIDAKAGESRTLSLEFPESYHVKELAGKPVSFEVEVHAVFEPKLPEVDSDFVKQLGIADGDVNAFRNQVKERCDVELEQRLKDKIKGNVMDALLEVNEVELPKVMVQEEMKNLRQEFADKLAQQGVDAANMQLPLTVFEKQAERKVSLGLILSEIAKQQEIKIKAESVRDTVNMIASGYEKPEEVVNWYYGDDRRRLAGVESLVLEDQVVEWVLENSDVSERIMTMSELVDDSKKVA